MTEKDTETLPGHASSGPETPTAIGDGPIGEPPEIDAIRDIPAGYRFVAILGRGGMGEVLLAQDEAIGRDVAIKRMRDTAASLETRFLREAKIQARLQHPSIVPVHELGRDRSGRPYFTMKRLTGTTLEVLLAAPRQRLLRAFVDACHALG